MKKLLFTALFCIFSCLSNAQTNSTDTVVHKIQKMNMDSFMQSEMDRIKRIEDEAVGKPFVPVLLLENKSGISLNQLKEKVIFLNFWFASCAPCIAEFKGLNEMYAKFSGNKNFKFISFTFEDDKTIAEIRKQYGILYEIIHVTEKECRTMNLLGGFPVNILLGQNTIVNTVYFGGMGSETVSREFIIQKIFPEINKLLQKPHSTN